ncbi:carbohydrate ABC transporter permease [Paenibacillus cymbidii]|uniref:carbohydrate ABC transporter permease n=1 Tax=Paenibacillus cymbidii TaxID=1639034 RepID=UPI0010821B58|nr:sugar ABC transporter permease [Paenibacillus cymbidii]
MLDTNKYFWTGVVFLLPISAMMLTFLVVPSMQTIALSLTSWTGIGRITYVGLENYRIIMDDASFLRALKRTLFMGFSIALLTNLFGLTLALALDRAFRTQKALRALFFIPKLIPIVVAAFIWKYMLDANNGMINKVLSELLGRDVKLLLIDTPGNVVWTVIGIAVWQIVGPVMLVYLAALQTVPHELKEAGLIDGANAWQRFRSIVLPLIAPGITINVLIGLANGLKLFDLPFALTGGGPANASETLAIRIYSNAFQSSELGYGMAGAFVLTGVVLVITFVFVFLSKKYEGTVHG